EVRGPASNLDQLRDCLVFTARRQPEAGRVPVGLRILPVVVEARVAETRTPRRLRIDLIQVLENRLYGSVQRIEVQPVETDPGGRIGQRLVVPLQPFDQLDHFRVPPHPERETAEVAKRLLGVAVVAHAPYVA